MNPFYRFIYQLTPLLLFTITISAQERLFHKLTVEDGLSQNSVLSFAQDKQGYMWIGTSSGLNRYDSRSFRIYKTVSNDPGSISGNNIPCLLVDHKDRIWAGTTNGLNRYDKKTGLFHHYQKDPESKNGLGNNVIRAIYEDQKKQIWVATQKGLYILHEKGSSIHFEEIKIESDGKNILAGDIRTIKEDIKGDIWVGTAGQIVKITKNFSERVFKIFQIPGNINSIEDRTCTSIEEDEKHQIWIGTMGSGLFRINLITEQIESVANASHPIYKLPHDYIRKIRKDKNGKIWIGTQQGLCELEISTGKIKTYQHNPGNKYSLSQNSIYDVYTDNAGNLWAGTYYGGISISYARNTPFQIEQATGKSDGLGSNLVSSILYEPGKGVWIGSDAGGISFRDEKTGYYRHYKYNVSDFSSLGSNLVKCVFKDRDGQIWVGTHGGGLNQLNADRNGFTRFKKIEGNDVSLSSNDIMSIAEDYEGVLWLATENNGLNSFDKKTKKITRYHRDSVGVHHLNTLFLRMVLMDQMGNLWVASEAGLYYKKRGEKIFKAYQEKFSEGKQLPEGEAVRTVFEDSRKQLWIGSANKGIFLIDHSNDKLTTYTTENGLPSNNIKGIIEDLTGNLWITTDNGLCKFERQTRSFIPFNIYDGLPGNDFNANSFFRDKNGRIFVGSLNGLIHFDPNKIEKNNISHQVRFNNLRIGNEWITPQNRPDVLDGELNQINEIELAHKDNVVTIEFSLLNFIKPKKNQYLYRLNGFEKEWTLNNSGAVTYTNLPAGNYTLEVKAANNDGVWNPEISTLSIKVQPPYWNTWWAYVLYLIFIVYIVYMFIRSFLIREKYKQSQQLQQYKIDFFTNISHEIRTQLTLISTPLDAIVHNELPENMKKGQLEIIQKHTQRLTNLVSELLDFRKAENGSMSLKMEEIEFWPMLEEIAEGFKPIANENNIELNLSVRDVGINVTIDRQQMSKVVSNLISNAIKFTEKGGKVGLELKQKGSYAILRIWDTGIGIDPKYFRNLFTNFFQVNDERSQNTGYGIGLALAKSIVELHNGVIDVSSKVKKQGHNGFTVFTVKLPIIIKEVKTDTTLTLHTIETREKPLLLVIEDHEDLRRFIADSLSREFEIIEAENGEIGLMKANEYIPDLIISDIMMPIMDGLELCEQIKKDKNTCHIPVILLTAKATLDDQIKGLEYSADAYITKPFDLRLLRTQVDNLLRNRASLQESYRSHYLSPDNIKIEKEVDVAPDPFIQKMVEIIYEHIENTEFTISDLTKKMAVSQPVLYKKIKALTGLSVNDFIKSLRMKRAAELIQSGKHTVAEVAYLVGFSDRKYFSKEFKKFHGKVPSEYGD